jgi:hypothetical protein
MQNADVPLWDKGDKTDDYAKGGGSGFSFFDSEDRGDKSEEIEKIYDMVLGRKPTSRELSYYRYATTKKDEIVKKLLKSDEHKNLVQKGKEFPELEEREKLGQSTIIKLKHSIEDQQEEFSEMKALLQEKNREISTLREEKNIPYVTQSFLEGKGVVYYQNTAEKKQESRIPTPKNWVDKLFYFIQNFSK